ncbi:MAG: CHRD domain-containing protein [Stigonema ocellatum SAG 48.90 = DSM 106950]|nr:CHRD domain-containing protein [Stigonema ocellatum SAG 48.90 = DSM 106950]
MTHPIGSLPIYPSNTVTLNSSQNDDDTEDHQNSQSTNTSRVVDDYLLVPQDDPSRPAIYTSGDLYTFLATTKETNFGFNAFDFFVPAGGGPPPHIHNYEHEAFFVTEGNFRFFLGNEAGVPDTDKQFILDGLPAGTFIFGARLRPHGFANPNSTAATSGTNEGGRIFSLTTPGGLDLLFDFAGKPVTNRNNPIPLPSPGVDPKQLEFGQRTGGSVAFPGYEPPPGTLNYVLVLPDDAPEDLKENIKSQLTGIDGFSVSTYSERPTFTGPFGIDYTSLASLPETGNELSYNEFSLAPKATNTFVQANLNGNQEVDPIKSLATGVANIKLNEQGDIDYSLTVKGLNFEKFVEWGTPQTSDNKDYVTGIYIDSGDGGSNGSHVFNILDPSHQDGSYQWIWSNPDGDTTINGTWHQTDKEIPTDLSDFLAHSGLPGQESGFNFEVDTSDHPTGEIRGQIASTTNDFPDQVASEDYEAFYVRKGQLSFKIGDETRLAGPDTFVYIPPGKEYSLGNFGQETVDSLAISVIPQAQTPPQVPGNTGDEANQFNPPIYGTSGDDVLVAGSNDQLFGGEGDDILKIGSGGHNLLYGGSGSDLFWIADGRIPDTVPDTRQLTDFGLPPLEDTQNTIVNFTLSVDKIRISGISDISSFDNLKLLPAFGDIRSTSIIASLDGKDVSLANVSGIVFNQLSAADFVFA